MDITGIFAHIDTEGFCVNRCHDRKKGCDLLRFRFNRDDRGLAIRCFPVNNDADGPATNLAINDELSRLRIERREIEVDRLPAVGAGYGGGVTHFVSDDSKDGKCL
jgi:hypothetical protein